MDTIECLKTRRSIRKFKSPTIPDDTIIKVLDLARHAPSSMDSQPWEFVIIKNSVTKEKLAELKGEENRECILSAPVIICVCVDMNRSKSRWAEDGVCATMNILLAAHEFGLGGVYITGYSPSDPKVAESIKEILNLPLNIIPVTIVPIGIPDEAPGEKNLRDMGSMIHYGRF